ncbi:Nudix-like NDP and NTP phosphohydrolase YmfB [gamma proteobacterium IMCC2047]|nr:Nudix-like NDP and NTP phosphohydrolase YmfB [gamma proteobacterium IMCC2047]
MTDAWHPHLTVAVIVEVDGNFLIVKEISDDKVVLNQPAGHVEENETLFEAAQRETLEETGWHVRIESLVGFYLYRSPDNNTTYFRTLFSAVPLKEESNATLDDGILEAQWLSLEEIQQQQSMLRSPMVLTCIEDYLAGKRLPLDCISHLSI